MAKDIDIEKGEHFIGVPDSLITKPSADLSDRSSEKGSMLDKFDKESIEPYKEIDDRQSELSENEEPISKKSDPEYPVDIVDIKAIATTQFLNPNNFNETYNKVKEVGGIICILHDKLAGEEDGIQKVSFVRAAEINREAKLLFSESQIKYWGGKLDKEELRNGASIALDDLEDDVVKGNIKDAFKNKGGVPDLDWSVSDNNQKFNYIKEYLEKNDTRYVHIYNDGNMDYYAKVKFSLDTGDKASLDLISLDLIDSYLYSRKDNNCDMQLSKGDNDKEVSLSPTNDGKFKIEAGDKHTNIECNIANKDRYVNVPSRKITDTNTNSNDEQQMYNY